MSDRLADAVMTIRAVAESGRDVSAAVLWPPRRTILVAGIMAVSICVFIGTSLSTVALIGASALAAFSMGHVERRMYAVPQQAGEHTTEHSTRESTEYRAHSTTTTTEED